MQLDYSKCREGDENGCQKEQRSCDVAMDSPAPGSVYEATYPHHHESKYPQPHSAPIPVESHDQ